jgi:hypothetical protein
MADLVEELAQGIRARLKELGPVVAEYGRLEAAYAALDGAGSLSDEGALPSGAQQDPGRGGVRRSPATSASRPSRPRAKRGQNKAAVFRVVDERPGVTVTELAEVTGIAKPLVYNTTRAGVERGELERVSLPGGVSGFRIAPAANSSEPA